MSQPDVDDIDSRWARSFGVDARAYDRFRPPLPAAVVDWLGPASRAVDIGAGTGQASRALAASGSRVTAVEPDPAMAAVLASTSVGVCAVRGTTEALPIRSGWADLVVSVSAWHWFDQRAAFAEAHRVLRPGGCLGIVWNGVDQSDTWGREFMAATETSDNTVVAPDDRPGPDTLTVPAGPRFEDVATTTICWQWTRNIDEVLDLVGTYSVVITASPDLRRRIMERARTLLADITGDDGRVVLPMATRCWRATSAID